ncbi:hypothetical protein [Flavivirga sp. 57AJ16]|uniref:hypothetical protein n=1 Tax=Flavivirga sp. 57AJ16 TaxID=3025307 RepID=UPI002367157B|nr:hypothetical protein [Flavivirga sp. 57AJ16]MDD7887115.1 hypothetical protein [Flavivirga sp. 57AJ16]
MIDKIKNTGSFKEKERPTEKECQDFVKQNSLPMSGRTMWEFLKYEERPTNFSLKSLNILLGFIFENPALDFLNRSVKSKHDPEFVGFKKNINRRKNAFFKKYAYCKDLKEDRYDFTKTAIPSSLNTSNIPKSKPSTVVSSHKFIISLNSESSEILKKYNKITDIIQLNENTCRIIEKLEVKDDPLNFFDSNLSYFWLMEGTSTSMSDLSKAIINNIKLEENIKEKKLLIIEKPDRVIINDSGAIIEIKKVS